MKTILVSILLASNLAFATESHVVAQVASVDAKIASVQLMSSGHLIVNKRDKTTQVMKLSEANKSDLLESVQMLSEAELETEVHIMVCMMMIAPYSIQNLSVYDQSTHNLKIVLSKNSCALSSYTHPKEDYLMETARTLKAQILVLTQQIVK